MSVRAEIYEQNEKWGPPLVVSAGLHAALTVAIVVAGWLHFRTGSDWGSGSPGGGEAMSATLVSSVPLPRPNVETNNVLATENKGLSQTEATVPEIPQPNAIEIPDRASQRKPWERAQSQRNARPKPTPVEQARNVVPYGEGGPVSSAYSMGGTSFSMGNSKGGLIFGGGGGDFGSRFAWYVDAVRRKVSENWMKYEIDPSASGGRKTYLTFDINRDGSPSNVRVEQSSGVPSLDISAVRALQRIDTFGRLPDGYAGSKVSVEFWFQR